MYAATISLAPCPSIDSEPGWTVSMFGVCVCVCVMLSVDIWKYARARGCVNPVCLTCEGQVVY